MIQAERRTILIVDDEPWVTELLARWLTPEGYTCAVASSGEEALDILAAMDCQLLVSDIKMPGMSGIELLERVRALFPDTAVLMATSVTDRETAIMTLRLGAYGYVIKPFDKNEILLNVVNALERRRMTLSSREHERSLKAEVRLNEKYRRVVRHFPYGIAEFALEQPVPCTLPAREILPFIWQARLVDANHAFAEGYGFGSVQELLGMSLRAIMYRENNALALFTKWIENGFAVTSVEMAETDAKPDARCVETSLMGFVKDARLETFWTIRQDITERKISEETIRRQREFLDTILASLTHPVYVINATNFAIEKANPVAQSLGIVEKAMCYEVTFRRTEPCDCSTRLCPVREITKTKQPVCTERVQEGPTGGLLHLEIHACPIFDRQGNVMQIVESCVDVSDRKMAQNLLIQSEKFKAVADLTAGVAHNFNNLLQVIIGNAQVALMDLENGNMVKTHKRLDKIVDNCRLGAETVRRLKQFAMENPEARNLGARNVDLSLLAGHACEMTSTWMKSYVQDKAVSIDLHMDLQEGCFVQVREGEIQEVLVNLVKNAVEAMPQGGTITISTKILQEKVVLTVHDTGIGIAPDVVHRLFTPFFTTKHGIGTGLGLATSRGIIRKHGGQMVVESTPGRGTVFTITLPYAVPIHEQKNSLAEPAVLSRTTALVIDDMEPVVITVKDGLTRFGHTVFTALSGEQGMEMFKQHPVDLVICDLAMPGMSGWGVGKAIKDFCNEQHILKPLFIILTGWNAHAKEGVQRAESGVDAIVEKPIHMERLIQIVKELHQKTKNAP